jgi:hypothetical protein
MDASDVPDLKWMGIHLVDGTLRRSTVMPEEDFRAAILECLLKPLRIEEVVGVAGDLGDYRLAAITDSCKPRRVLTTQIVKMDEPFDCGLILMK